MNKPLLSLLTATFALSLAAEPSGDRPDERHAWAVHDVNRPDPKPVACVAGQPPGDAVVLFDGSAESIAKNWCDSKGGPSKWKTENGLFVCVPKSGPAVTKEKFADCQLHVEWMTPKDDPGGFGNSGVIFFGRYEIQILDSYAVKASKSPWKEANYADGQAGAVYGQNPPIVQPARKPGEWQSYDIVFHPPLWEKEKMVDPGSFTVFFNGVLVQDHWPLEGTTTWCRRTKSWTTEPEGPLCLQDHGNPVPFRNIWIRRIPSRFANTTCGGPGVKPADVARLRDRLAEEAMAAAKAATDVEDRMIRLWEAYGYRPDAAVRQAALTASAELVRVSAKWDAKTRKAKAARIAALGRFVKMLVRSGFIAADDPLTTTFR